MIRPALLVPLLAFGLSASALAQTTYQWVDERGQVNFSDRPPPSSVKALEEKRYATPPSGTTLPYTLRKLTEEFPVTLYTSDNCGEYCDTARALLTARGIPYSESKLATAEDLVRYRQRFGSPESVPTLSVGNTPYKGFEANAWGRLLDDVGYPKAP